MILPCVPLVADGDWIGLVVFIIVVVISAISQMIAKIKEAAQPPKRPMAGMGPKDRALQDEIGEFLRNVGQPKPQEQSRPGSRTAGQRPSLTARGSSQRRAPKAPRPLEAVLVDEAGLGSPTPGQPRRVSTLSSSLEKADEQEEARVHNVFDHTLGQFGGGIAADDAEQPSSQPGAAALPASAAAGLAVMLADRANVRTAIVLSEILQRPEHRWG
jgi:hypothetical protein